MKVHFIAIGGSAMHNLALAMKAKGFEVTGSDDEIAEPSRSRLEKAGLLPAQTGWFPEKLSIKPDAVILGMHAREDNPELIKARQLGLKIFSYPEYIYEQTRQKNRVVIGGSHGKTTITAIILHVLQKNKVNTDFMVGAQLKGFDTMVKLTADAPVAVIEGDEYLSSPIDRRPKFHLYKPNIALLSGIAWDHINVFPTFEIYLQQFEIFINLIESGGCLIYDEKDPHLTQLCKNQRKDIEYIPYNRPVYEIKNGLSYIQYGQNSFEVQLFGDHNMANLEGARRVCEKLGIEAEDFYRSVKDFSGAARRLEKVAEGKTSVFYKDFAHSPSKLKATTSAMKKQFPERKLTACMELHTFSSLNEDFLREYAGAMDLADEAIVYFNPATIAHKKLKPISTEQVQQSFGRKDLKTFTSSKELDEYLSSQNWNQRNLLMMSSGTFDQINLNELAERIYASEKMN